MPRIKSVMKKKEMVVHDTLFNAVFTLFNAI